MSRVWLVCVVSLMFFVLLIAPPLVSARNTVLQGTASVTPIWQSTALTPAASQTPEATGTPLGSGVLIPMCTLTPVASRTPVPSVTPQNTPTPRPWITPVTYTPTPFITPTATITATPTYSDNWPIGSVVPLTASAVWIGSPITGSYTSEIWGSGTGCEDFPLGTQINGDTFVGAGVLHGSAVHPPGFNVNNEACGLYHQAMRYQYRWPGVLMTSGSVFTVELDTTYVAGASHQPMAYGLDMYLRYSDGVNVYGVTGGSCQSYIFDTYVANGVTRNRYRWQFATSQFNGYYMVGADFGLSLDDYGPGTIVDGRLFDESSSLDCGLSDGTLDGYVSQGYFTRTFPYIYSPAYTLPAGVSGTVFLTGTYNFLGDWSHMPLPGYSIVESSGPYSLTAVHVGTGNFEVCSPSSGYVGEPMPWMTPTPMPGSCWFPSAITGTNPITYTPIISYTPPTIIPGLCYTIIPAVHTTILQIPFLLPNGIEVDITGVEVCVNYLRWGLIVMNFDFGQLASILIALMCAGLIINAVAAP